MSDLEKWANELYKHTQGSALVGTDFYADKIVHTYSNGTQVVTTKDGLTIIPKPKENDE